MNRLRKFRNLPCLRGAIALWGSPREKFFGDDQGAGIVEFAFSSMIFLALLIGLFDFSLALYTFHYVSNAARQGSRYAMVRGLDCSAYSNTTPCPAQESDISSYVKSLGYPGIDPSHMTVTVFTYQNSISEKTGSTSWVACGEGVSCNLPGSQVQVKVTYSFPLEIPFWGSRNLSIDSSSNMVYQQ